MNEDTILIDELEALDLDISNTAIADLSPLSALKNLERLDITDCPITDWSPVAHIENIIGRPESEQPKE